MPKQVLPSGQLIEWGEHLEAIKDQRETQGGEVPEESQERECPGESESGEVRRLKEICEESKNRKLCAGPPWEEGGIS